MKKRKASERILSYKPRIRNRPIIAALKKLAMRNKMTTNSYIEMILLKHMEDNGVEWTEETLSKKGDLTFHK